MTEPEKQQPAPVENILLLRREDFDELLTHAAERGAERVLTHLGLENGHPARDIRELRHLLEARSSVTVNLGTGQGYSVIDVVRAFEKASGRPVPYRIVARRPGDIASCYADPAAAEQILGWKAQFGIDRMCEDWQRYTHYGVDAFMQDFDSACTNYGGCGFFEACDHKDPEPFLEMDFEFRVWNPVAVTD